MLLMLAARGVCCQWQNQHQKQCRLMLDDLGPVQIVARRVETFYPDELSLRRLLALAKVESARIPFDGRAANMAFFATVEAARQGRLGDLVGVMLEEYPVDPWLVGIFSSLQRGKWLQR